MITATCHCGAVSLTVAEGPAQVTDCNCSICRRYGVLWDYRQVEDVEIATAPDAIVAYMHGEKTLAFNHCRICGCVTHWSAADPAKSGRIGINARLMPPDILAAARIRHLDGADTWTYSD